jgi:hypothetical protein
MKRNVHEGTPSTTAHRTGRLAAGCLVVLACVALLAGCGRRGVQTVPVSGKLTFAGGPWPREGVVFFSPAQAAEGLPLIPVVATFNADGAFVVKTNARPGLVPGKYRVAVHCWEKAPSHEGAGKSYVPARFLQPETSGLELTVEPSSRPIVWNQDIPKGP